MSLTFTSWAACTDDGTGQAFALNWTADTGMLPYIHLEAIRQAICERAAASGTAISSLLLDRRVVAIDGVEEFIFTQTASGATEYWDTLDEIGIFKISATWYVIFGNAVVTRTDGVITAVTGEYWTSAAEFGIYSGPYSVVEIITGIRGYLDTLDIIGYENGIEVST